MDRVRMGAAVDELDPEQIAFRRADHRPWNGAVVRPGREEDARRDLDLPVDRAQRVLAHSPALVRERRRRVRERIERARRSDRRNLRTDHGRVAAGRVVVDVPVQVPLRGLRVAAERELSEHRRRGERRGADKEATAREP
jgi:hypothetical protein